MLNRVPRSRSGGGLLLLLLPLLLLMGIFGGVLAITSQPQPSGSSQEASLGDLQVIPTTPGVELTDAQVLSYVGTSAFVGGPTVSGGVPTILECRKMMSKQAEKVMGTTITPDDRPVFYVKLRGPFYNFHVLARDPKAPPALIGEEVFDARTGDELVWGTR